MKDFFSSAKPVITAYAPGRMDVMGGIADYSGSLLLQMPIEQITTVSIQKRNDSLIKIKTQLFQKRFADFEIDYHLFEGKSYEESGKLIKQKEGGKWAVYMIGCILVLENEKKLPVSGLNIYIESEIPWGKGVSSSAALEVATMHALVKLYKINIEKTELSVLAQKAENLVATAPCGLMDQLSVNLGKKNKLLPLVCQPHQVFDTISIPKEISFCGIDSGVRHAVSGASYNDVRVAAFMAYSIIALSKGVSKQELIAAEKSGDLRNLPFKGFLANITTDEFEEEIISDLPDKLTGKEFNEQFNIFIDKVTAIDPDKAYHIKACAAHPVYENCRIHIFKDLITNFSIVPDKLIALQKMGELMLESHKSYTDVGLGNQYTDEIVELVIEAGNEKGLYGARVSGGGSGGTVCVLCYGKEGRQNAKKIFDRYKNKQVKEIFFFSGSNQGAFYLNNNPG